jgi:hypothetical protein
MERYEDILQLGSHSKVACFLDSALYLDSFHCGIFKTYKKMRHAETVSVTFDKSHGYRFRSIFLYVLNIPQWKLSK